jgi:histidinol phosphatase-like enzyme
MLLAALQSFDGSPRKSAMVGDKASDMEAAAAAAINQRFLVSGEVTAAPSGGATIVPDLEEAVGRFLNCIRRSQP